MPKAEDLTGRVYGELTVLKRAENKDSHHTAWLCRCRCGNITTVSTDKLKSGKIKSCGCMRYRKGRENPRFEDIAGQRFGRLTAVEPDLERTDAADSSKTYWTCRCDCGKTVSVSIASLKNGTTKSCGCLRRRKGSDSPNFIDLTGQRFGKLTVIEPDAEHAGKGTWWKCKCDCGNTVCVEAGKLKSGRTKSCGCAHHLKGPENPNFIDLTGQRFGKLLVLAPDADRSDKGNYMCQCDCGNRVSVSADSLRNGTKSCGCLKHRTGFENPDFINLTGTRYGSLVAEKPVGNTTEKGTWWLCRCDCGNLVPVSANKLRGGHTMSCGCEKRSHGERMIKEYLDGHGFAQGIDYRTQARFEDLKGADGGNLSYDFEILNPIHCLIEYQGEQHFRAIGYFGGEQQLSKQMEHDRLKADYAKENDIPLYYLTYDDDSPEKVSEKMDMMFAGRINIKKIRYAAI